MANENKIVEFPPSAYLTPEAAFAEAIRLPWTHVIILGYDDEDDMRFRASRMSRQDILWLLETLKRTLWEDDDA